MPNAAPDPLDDLAIGYVLPTEEESADIWKRATIAVDANVLLNIYRYSPEAREQLLSALSAVRARLFVPHQAATEYFRHRTSILTEQLTAREQMRAAIDHAIDNLLDTLSATHSKLGRRQRPDEQIARARTKLEDLRAEVLAVEATWLPSEDLREDELHPRLAEVIRGAVGQPYSPDRLAEIAALAQERYDAQIPPGYLDADKDNDFAMGDLVLWMQVIDHAKTAKLPVVLVTDDQKEDWFWQIKNRNVGPRPELVREMHAEAGAALMLYTTSRFLTHAARDGEAQVDQRVIEEAETHESERRNAQEDRTPEMSLADVVLKAARRSVDRAAIENPPTSSATVRSGVRPYDVALCLDGRGNIGQSVVCTVVSPEGDSFSIDVPAPIGSSIQLSFPSTNWTNRRSGQPLDVSGLPAGRYVVVWFVSQLKSDAATAHATDVFVLTD